MASTPTAAPGLPGAAATADRHRTGCGLPATRQRVLLAAPSPAPHPARERTEDNQETAEGGEEEDPEEPVIKVRTRGRGAAERRSSRSVRGIRRSCPGWDNWEAIRRRRPRTQMTLLASLNLFHIQNWPRREPAKGTGELGNHYIAWHGSRGSSARANAPADKPLRPSLRGDQHTGQAALQQRQQRDTHTRILSGTTVDVDIS